MIRCLALLAITVLVSACAGFGEKPTGVLDEWTVRSEALRAIDHWSMRGRIAMSTPADAWSGSLTWEQDSDDVDMRMRGPLGFGGFRIYGDLDSLELRTNKGEILVLDDPETDLRRQLGFGVPVYSMRYWMLGVSDPASTAREQFDEQGLLSELEQRGWQILYQDYRLFEGRVLPRRLVISNKSVQIKLAVDRWVLGSF